MPSRDRAVALAALAVVLALLAACAGPSSGTAASSPHAPGTQLDTPMPASLLNMPLRDQAGRMRPLSSFKGKILVISDLLTLCQETCAIGTASMLQAARTVDQAGLADSIEFVSITVDPKRDDLRHLAAYQRLYGRLPNWELLTGSRNDIDRLWDTLGIWRRTVQVPRPYPRDWLTGKPLTYDIQHTDDLIFVSGSQRVRFEIDGPGSVASARTIPSRIYTFMDGLGHRNVHNPSAGSWTSAQVVTVLRWLGSKGTS